MYGRPLSSLHISLYVGRQTRAYLQLLWKKIWYLMFALLLLCHLMLSKLLNKKLVLMTQKHQKNLKFTKESNLILPNLTSCGIPHLV